MSEVCQNTHEIKEHKLCKVNNSFMFAICFTQTKLTSIREFGVRKSFVKEVK
jgi:hypothetical protein